jgi:hypothetical protein
MNDRVGVPVFGRPGLSGRRQQHDGRADIPIHRGCTVGRRVSAGYNITIVYLPYSPGDSARLRHRVQGYSFWVAASTGKPIQVGVSPDRTNDGAIGYAFNSRPARDRADKSAKPYRHPQSFYFSGYPFAARQRANRDTELHGLRHGPAESQDDLGCRR